MKSIGKYLSEKYVSENLIDSKFSEAYAYIFDYIFNFMLYNASLLILGLVVYQPFATIIYIIVTGALRAISGGYHCKSRISCFLLSYSVFAIYLYFNTIKILFSTYTLLAGYLICWILILIISPVDNPNKHFTNVMKKKARKRIFMISIFNSIFTILSLLLNCNKSLYSNDLSLIICTIGLYAGYFSNRRQPYDA